MRFIWLSALALLCAAAPFAAAQQIDPTRQVKWPAGCTGVYAPGSNTCVAPGTAANPAGSTFQVQFNGGGTFSSDNLFTYNPASHTLNGLNSTFQLPRIDPRNSFVLGSPYFCMNAADPTGNLDSTCAIKAAITYQNSLPIASGSKPSIYLASGIYSVASGPLIISGTASIEGDSRGATVLKLASSTGNLITDNISVGRPIANIGLTLRDITLQGTGSIVGLSGKNTLGALLEVNGDYALNLQNVNFIDADGTCLNLENGAERGAFSNLTFSNCRRAIQMGVNINETHLTGSGLNIINSGIDTSGYCWNKNCTNGVVPAPNQGTPVAATWTASTFYPHDQIINDGTTNCSGQACNWVLITQANTSGTSTPAFSTHGSDGQTVTDGSSGQMTWLNISNRTLISPDYHATVFFNGVNVNIDDCSIKGGGPGLAGVVNLGEANNIKNCYFEELSGGSNMSGDNPSIVVGRPIEHFPLAGNITSSATAIPISNMMWFPFYLDSTTDAQAAAASTFSQFAIVPNDYNPNSSSPSAVQPGVNQNQYELINVQAGAHDGNVYATRCASGSTICTSWNSGDSFMFWANFSAPNASGSVTANHFHYFGPPGPGYAWNCNDITAPCGEIIDGYVADGVVLTATSKFPKIPGSFASLVIDGNNSFFTSATGDSGHLVGSVIGSIVKSSVYTGMTTQLSQTTIDAQSFINGNFTGAALGIGFIPWPVWTSSTAVASYALNTPQMNMATSPSFSTSESLYDIQGSASVGGHVAVFEQFQNQKCWETTPAAGATSYQRFCLKGGPTFAQLFTIDSCTAVNTCTTSFSVNPGTGNVQNFGGSYLITNNGFNQFISSAAMTNNRTFTLPDSNSNPVQPLTAPPAGFSGLGWIDSAGVQHGVGVTGTATLASGTATVSNAAACAVGASCKYQLTNCGPGGTAIGVPSLGTVTAGTSFVINSISATNTVVTGDASTICWKIN